MSRVLVINGPNLDQLGTREPEIYGRTTLAELEAELKDLGDRLGIEVAFFQANDEAALVDRVHTISGEEPAVDAVVINPGAVTHYSRALGDALSALSQPVVEVHISNILEREPFRRRSAMAANSRIYGRGTGGYSSAIRHIVNRLAWRVEKVMYGPLPDQYGDWRRPNGTASRLAVVVHGGLWRHEWTADTTEGIAIDLTRRGWATVNLEYRRLGLGGGWPETFEDLARALEHLPETTGIEPESTALIGHSAGATMVLWAASFHPGPIAALAPFPDLVRAAQDPVWSGPVSRLLEADQPSPELYSPQHRSRPLGPTVVAAAREDSVSPPDAISAYAEAFSTVDFVLCEGSHGSFLEPSSSAWGLVVDWLQARKVTL